MAMVDTEDMVVMEDTVDSEEDSADLVDMDMVDLEDSVVDSADSEDMVDSVDLDTD